MDPTLTYPARLDGPLAITNVTVVPMDAERLLDDHTVIIERGKVTRIGPSALIDTGHIHTVDGSGQYLMPGLAEMHGHFGDPRDQFFAQDPGDCALYLAAGVTLVRDLWSQPFQLQLRNLVDEGRLPGPRMVTTSPLVDGPAHAGTSKPIIYRSAVLGRPEDAESLVKSFAHRGYDQLKVYGWLSAEVLASLGRAAADNGLPMTGHCPHEVDFHQAIDAGMRCFEHLHGVFAGNLRDGAQFDMNQLMLFYMADPAYIDSLRASFDWAAFQRLAERMAEAQVWNCPTITAMGSMLDLYDDDPRLALLHPLTAASWIAGPHKTMFPPPADPERTRLAAGRRKELLLEMIAKLHAAGAPLLVGTDAPVGGAGPGLAIHDELDNFVRAGLSPYQALRCATTEPARFLGQSDLSGTVAEGKRADLVLLDRDPLADITAVRDIAAVFVNGYHLTRPQLDDLILQRRRMLSAPLAQPVLTASGALDEVVASGGLVEERYGREVGRLSYRHTGSAASGWAVEESLVSHSRRRDARVQLLPDLTLGHATISTQTAIGDEHTDIQRNNDRGYEVRIRALDGHKTTVTVPRSGLLPSDELALTGVLRMVDDMVSAEAHAAARPALSVDGEAVEEHLLTAKTVGSATDQDDGTRRYAMEADHPREPAFTIEVELAKDGTLFAWRGAGFTERHFRPIPDA